MAARRCSASNQDGQPCGSPTLVDDEFCFSHSPSTVAEAAEARRLGGLRRRKEHAVSAAYDFEGLRSLEQIQRYLEIAALDTLALENSARRSHAAARIASVALHALDRGELEQLLRTLETARRPR